MELGFNSEEIEQLKEKRGCVMTQDPNVSKWWQTDIIDMKPGEIRYRGYEIQDSDWSKFHFRK